MMARNTLYRKILRNRAVSVIAVLLGCLTDNLVSAMLSRGFYGHMIPLLFRHYRSPLGLKDIPAVREDDTAAACLASWRLAGKSQGTSSRSREQKGGPSSQHRILALRLLWHFRKEFAEQAVSGRCRKPQRLNTKA
jgi:hypothetical protein